MQTFEASINFQAVWFDAADRLTTTKQLLTYLTNGLPDIAGESFWIVSMNPNRRPICRTRLKTGALVAARVYVRDVMLALPRGSADHRSSLTP